ncbi:hypothetical protein POVCU2_0017560 [Plasmodium ovale curtisi]|uniref:Uncharacterized protein n=1 Tax=Plasmodium ovale curtisi TaxID=864141 RepID=A0A1A8VU39_PLAOA|nr:hypothetical protein POVCU2_0017560 [Plasmodium ovale curtisi]SBS88363.1 hypothetical protein POVCU1_015700 [Plasmodium ovale curtisi]
MMNSTIFTIVQYNKTDVSTREVFDHKYVTKKNIKKRKEIERARGGRCRWRSRYSGVTALQRYDSPILVINVEKV